MKITIWKIVAITFTAVALSTASLAAHHEGAAEEEVESDTSELGTAMEELGGAFKKLARAMRAPNPADIGVYQTQVAIIKKQAVRAKGMMPVLVEEAGDQKDTLAAAYQKSMTEFIGMVENLEIVLADGDLAKAQTMVSKLNEARKKGHKKFQKQDDGD